MCPIPGAEDNSGVPLPLRENRPAPAGRGRRCVLDFARIRRHVSSVALTKWEAAILAHLPDYGRACNAATIAGTARGSVVMPMWSMPARTATGMPGRIACAVGANISGLKSSSLPPAKICRERVHS